MDIEPKKRMERLSLTTAEGWSIVRKPGKEEFNAGKSVGGNEVVGVLDDSIRPGSDSMQSQVQPGADRRRSRAAIVRRRILRSLSDRCKNSGKVRTVETRGRISGEIAGKPYDVTYLVFFIPIENVPDQPTYDEESKRIILSTEHMAKLIRKAEGTKWDEEGKIEMTEIKSHDGIMLKFTPEFTSVLLGASNG